jgi:hypothetical protein
MKLGVMKRREIIDTRYNSAYIKIGGLEIPEN